MISQDDYRARDFFDRLFRRQRVVAQVGTWTVDARGTQTRSVKALDETSAINLVRATVRRAAREGDVLIVGRGGQAILQDEPGAFHVRIEAPLEDRVRWVQEQENSSEPEARDAVLDSDRAAQDYLKRFYDIDWADCGLYDLVISTRKLDAEAAADCIVQAVARMVAAPATA